MASERDFELLDDYLANKLSGDEKVAFEQRMEGDPELQQEFTVQQNIVEGIKRARLAELKGILQNTPVPAPGFGETLLAKVGAVAVVAGLIVAGVWFFTKDKNEELIQEPTPVAEKAPDTVQPETNQEEPKIDTAETTVAETEQATVAKDEKVAPKSSKKTKPAVAPVEPAKPELFDPTSELEDNASTVVAEQPTVEQIKTGGLRESVTSSLNIKNIADNKKLTFHYQFQAGDLILYGPAFKDSVAYEILEFFLGQKETTVYLYYSQKYYLLDRGATEAAKLKPVEDAALIRALDDRRKK
jgi:hypothetical protein